MTTEKSPAPRANAGSRAKSEVQQHQTIVSAVHWEADPGAFGLRGGSPCRRCLRASGRAGEPRGASR